MSLSVTSAKREFTPAGHCFTIHLPGGGQCPLVEFVYANEIHWKRDYIGREFEVDKHLS